MEMLKNRTNVVNIRLHDSYPDQTREKDVAIKSPQILVELVVLFIYGVDYQRQSNNNQTLLKFGIFVVNWITLIIILAATALFLIRRLVRLRRDGVISTLIDVMVIFIGGGHLRFSHKMERWIFAIMSISAIFINTLFLDGLLFPSYLHQQRNVDTFEKLAEINAPVYLGSVLRRYEPTIREMFK